MISIGDGKGNIIEVDFYVDENNILQPLGVLVTNDSRYELLPQTRDIAEEIPGMHGEYDFGSELKPKSLELDVVTKKGLTPFEKSNLQRQFAKFLDPTKGIKKLLFADDIQKLYKVKYSGRIQPDFYSTWFKFTIPFKMSDPFIYSTFEKSLVGTGKIKNEGTYETGLIIEITGPNDSGNLITVTIGGYTLTFDGFLTDDNTLTIETEKEVVKTKYYTVTEGFNNVFPMLEAEEELDVVAGNNVTIKWRDKWL